MPLEHLPPELWSDSPRARLRAARALSERDVAMVRKEVAKSSPMKPWPYGMPTVVNPYLVVLGVSPGNSPNQSDDFQPYDEPTVGHVHPKFLYEDSNHYWTKTRQLAIGMLRGFDDKLQDSECYALSGQLNLGVERSGKASEAKIEPEYARWVSRILTNYLRPRVAILLGLLNRLKHGETGFTLSGETRTDWNRPAVTQSLNCYSKKKMLFRAWNLSRHDGGLTTVIAWPQHPSQPPMKNGGLWEQSIAECVDYFIKPTRMCAGSTRA